jgi:hypothetical protein
VSRQQTADHVRRAYRKQVATPFLGGNVCYRIAINDLGSPRKDSARMRDVGK